MQNCIIFHIKLLFYISKYLCLTSLGEQQRQQQFSYISDDRYTALILEEIEKIYNKLTTKLTNRVIAAVTIRT
jgi:hypothetical protein